MQLFSWLHKRTTGQPQRGRTRARKAAPRFRPRLEALDGRDVPSTLTVVNDLDTGSGSLRAEIAAARNNDTIVFAPSLDGQTITLTSGELYIKKNLAINGPGAGQLTVSVGGASRIFEVAAKCGLTLSGLAISGGNVTQGGDVSARLGGGIYNHGTLTVSACTLSGNYALYGGAIFNDSHATLTVSGCTLSENSASGATAFPLSADPGGAGGAIFNQGKATLATTTLSDNHAGGPDFGMGDGGAIYNDSTGNMTISGCTLSGNSAGLVGGAISNYGALTVSGSLFSSNSPNDISGSYTDGGGNTFG